MKNSEAIGSSIERIHLLYIVQIKQADLGIGPSEVNMFSRAMGCLSNSSCELRHPSIRRVTQGHSHV